MTGVTAMLDEIESKRGELESAENDVLRKCGWSETCQTPGSIWLWTKTLDDGRVVLCTQSVALHFVECELS